MASITNVNMVVAGLLAAMFIGALDATVVATATPHMIKDLHGETLFSWVFAIYTLTTCVATPIFGKLADLFGRKPVFAAGIGLFVLGSILCGAAQSMTGLIWFRALQGFGAGALAPVCFTVIGDLFSGKQRGKMMGIFSSVWSVAGLLGPLIGGYFVDRLFAGHGRLHLADCASDELALRILDRYPRANRTGNGVRCDALHRCRSIGRRLGKTRRRQRFQHAGPCAGPNGRHRGIRHDLQPVCNHIGSKTELTAGMHAVFLLMLGIAIANLLTVSFLPKHRRVMAQQHSA
ncbi:MFS transporter [Cohnella hongkongensis]|uniref:MFS transporter n=1 Tax=Cohnella hongkongensis TaxID=178337 RepID=A0ABV9FJ67_9BACL